MSLPFPILVNVTFPVPLIWIPPCKGRTGAEGKDCSAKCEGDVYRLIRQGNYWPGTEPTGSSQSFGPDLCLWPEQK